MSVFVKGKCPLCHSGVFVSQGEWLTCSGSDCPDPTFVSEIFKRYEELLTMTNGSDNISRAVALEALDAKIDDDWAEWMSDEQGYAFDEGLMAALDIISELPAAPSRAEPEELSTLRGKVAMLEQALKTSAALTGEIVKQRDQLTKERDRWETAALKVRSSGRAEGTDYYS